MDSPPSVHSEAFLHMLMRRQLKLSVSCAVAFVLILFALPLANYFAPDFMAQRIGGFTMSWLILGIVMFPYVWIISAIFIRKSIALENEEVRVVQAEATRSAADS